VGTPAVGLGGHLLWVERGVDRGQTGAGEGFLESLGGGAAVEAIALMGSLEVVVLEVAIEVGLDFLDGVVPGCSPGDSEAFVEERSVHSLNETVGARPPDLGATMLESLEGQQELVGLMLGASAEFPSVVRECGSDRDTKRFVEGQDSIVEQVAGGDGQLGAVDLGEGERAEGVDDDLDVDLADSFESPPIEGALVQQLSRAVAFDVTAAKVGAVPFEPLDLLFGQYESLALGLPFQTEQALSASLELVA